MTKAKGENNTSCDQTLGLSSKLIPGFIGLLANAVLALDLKPDNLACFSLVCIDYI